MNEESDRKAWIEGNYLKKEQKINLDRKCLSLNNNSYQIVLEAEADNTVLVKSLVVLLDDFDGKQPDAMNITNGKNERVIPGSSLKGVIRSRVEAIAKYNNIEQTYIDKIFGRASNSEDNGISGTVIFNDTIIQNKKERPIPRIKIDKFTGGVQASALFSEMPVTGQMSLCVNISENKSMLAEAVVGIILLAFRDLALNMISLGSGANIGRGFINTSSITIKNDNQVLSVIDIKNMKTTKGEDFIVKCLNSIKELQGGTI